MEILKFLHREKLSPSWHYDVAGVMWRLFPTASGHLLGEERDLASKRTSFFCLDQVTGKAMWEKVTFAEQWWIGIEGVHRDMIFLHRFATPDLPEHKGIIAIDLLKGTTAWSNEKVKFIAARDASVYAALDSIEGRKIFEMNYRTGSVLRVLATAGEITGEADPEGATTVADSIQFPLAIDDLSVLSSHATAAVQRHCHETDVEGAVEILDYNDHMVIFSYYDRLNTQHPETPQMKNILRVLEKESGKVLFSDVLNSSVTAIVPESFFVQHHTLYYIKDRCRLMAVPLIEPSPTMY